MTEHLRRFRTTLRVTDPVMRDHRVYGVHVLPGVVLLDVVWRSAQACGFPMDEIELRNVLFLEPVAATEEFDQRIEIVFRKDGSRWQVQIRSRKIGCDDGAEGPWVETANAELRQVAPWSNEALAIEELKRRALVRRDLEDLYIALRTLEIRHGSFMKPAGCVHVAEEFALADLRLNEEAAQHAPSLFLQPALLDCATGISFFSGRVGARYSSRPFIPMFVESFRAARPLRSNCLVYVPAAPSMEVSADLHRDEEIRLLAPDGGVGAEIRGLAFKRIRSAEAIARLTQTKGERAEILMSRSGGVVDDSSTSSADGKETGNCGPEVCEAGRTATIGADQVAEDLAAMIAPLVKMSPDAIDSEAGFYDLGLESRDLLGLVHELEKRIGEPLYPTLLFEHSSIAALARFLTDRYEWKTPQVRTPEAEATPQPEAETAVRSAPSISKSKSRHAARGNGSCRRQNEDIAIVGLAGRYPGARTIEEFWRVLADGKNTIREVPSDRWDHSIFLDPGAPVKCPTKWGGFLEDHDKFDPLFFGISPKEAEQMDPQERLFLEIAWAALEDAGYTPKGLTDSCRPGRRDGDVGVFVGLMFGSYQLLGSAFPGAWDGLGPHSAFWSVANRISHFCDFTGPSLAIDTACSSSLTAIHLAVESIRRGECGAAMAGGVNLILHPQHFVPIARLNMLSRDHRCRAFGAGADGFVSGEGVGAVILRPLAEAIRHGDHIYGLIKASAINSGGKTSGYTVPNPAAQAEVIGHALRRAEIEPQQIGYLEAHGTGTALGDPLEIAGLTRAFSRFTAAKQFCAIGSVKSNIGHPQAAAGIAGLTKILLQLQHGELAPTLDAAEVNPEIDFAKTPFWLVREKRHWEAPSREEGSSSCGYPRAAGLSSFGLGGANAHLIVEEYSQGQSISAYPAGSKWSFAHLFPISGRTASALRQRVEDLLVWLRGRTGAEPDPGSCSFTLAAGRAHFSHRLAVVARSWDDVGNCLERFLHGEVADGLFHGVSEQRNRALGESPAATERLGPAGAANRSPEARLGSLIEVAESYVRGNQVEWDVLYRAEECRRLSLPTYPFARERYWIRLPESAQANGATRRRGMEPFHLYQRVWEAVPGGSRVRPNGNDRIVLFETGHDLGELMRQMGHRVVGVRPGGEFRIVKPDCVEIRPTELNDYERLLEHLTGLDARPFRVAHTWSWVGKSSEPGPNATGFETGAWFQHQRAITLDSLFLLSKALQRQKDGSAGPMLCLCPGSNSVQGSIAAAAAGLARSIRLEAPNLAWKVVRIDASANEQEQLETLESEWGSAEDPEVRFAGKMRWLPRLRPAAPSPAAPDNGKSLVRPGGVYVITGGAGGIGLCLADYLGRRYGARVVLVGRSPLEGTRETRIRKLQDAGVEVEYRRADICSFEQISDALCETRKCFGAIHGVVHAAGVIEDALLIHKELAAFDRVLAPKILGALHLDAATRQDPLDFLVFFSSLSSLSGNFGQCDYCAANRFLDEFTAVRESWRREGMRPGKTIVFDWPYWKEGGMRLPEWTEKEIERFSGLRPLETSAALEAMEAGLATGCSHLAVVTGNTERFVQLATQPASTPPHEVSMIAPRDQSVPDVEGRLLELISNFLGLEPGRLQASDHLSDFGLESRLVARLVDDINERFGASVTAAVFLAYPTVAQLAAFLNDQNRGPVVPHRSEPMVERPAGESHQVSELGKPVNTPEPIAVVGMAGVFPGALDVNAFWELICEGRQAIAEIPPERWDWRECYGDPETGNGRTRSKQAGFISEVDGFDSDFFNLSRREARQMDPRQRLLMEVLWKTIEDAGQAPGDLWDSATGLFVGAQSNEFAERQTEMMAQSGPGLSNAMLANRASSFFNLRGPSETMDTGCSSAALAVHRAVQAIRSGECEQALAAGAHLLLAPRPHLLLSQMGLLSSDEQSRVFDADVEGYLRGEGVAAVFLKPLSRALRDGNPIHGTIRGSAVVHNGRAASSIAPNPRAQTEAIRRAWRQSGVAPWTIGYIEAQGTGSCAGDAAEFNAIWQAFQEEYLASGECAGSVRCAIGSLKPNIGHLEAASGLAALIKTLLVVKHRKLPATLNIRRTNPELKLSDGKLFLTREMADWNSGVAEGGEHERLRAGVHSYGFGGTVVHLVVEEWPKLPVRENLDEKSPSREAGKTIRDRVELYVFSARDDDRLREVVERFLHWLRRAGREVDLSAMAHTLRIGRQAMEVRLAILAANRSELRQRLEGFLHQKSQEGFFLGRMPRREGVLRAGRSEEIREDLQQLWKSGRLRELAERWVAGEEIDWQRIGDGNSTSRISLPGYPFARTRFPLPPLEKGPVQGSASLEPAPRNRGSTNAPASDTRVDSPDLERIRMLTAEVLEMNPAELDVGASLPAIYGFDSILFVQLYRRLRSEGYDVSLQTVLENPTVRGLTEALNGTSSETMRPGTASALSGNGQNDREPEDHHRRFESSNKNAGLALSAGEAGRLLGRLDELTDEEVAEWIERLEAERAPSTD